MCTLVQFNNNPVTLFKIMIGQFLLTWQLYFPIFWIPSNIAIGFLKNQLEEQIIEQDRIKKFINVIKLCMGKHVFQYPNGFYEQIEREAMESLLSPFLAKIFMSKFEPNLKNICDNFPKILSQIDYIFVLVGKDLNMKVFIQHLNSYQPSI